MIPLFPILLFVTALSSIFLYLRTANDIYALLAVVMTLSCLIWGLIIAHWSVHLLALLALFFLRKPSAIATASSNK